MSETCQNKMKKNSRGVTLVELIMAMVILSAVALPMASMIGAQVQGMITSTDLTAAGNLARREMERLINLGSDNISPYTGYNSVVTGSSTINAYVLNWIVVTVPGSNGAERKDITLTAQRTGSTSVPMTLYGSIAKGVTYAP